MLLYTLLAQCPTFQFGSLASSSTASARFPALGQQLFVAVYIKRTNGLRQTVLSFSLLGHVDFFFFLDFYFCFFVSLYSVCLERVCLTFIFYFLNEDDENYEHVCQNLCEVVLGFLNLKIDFINMWLIY